jgi:hypothetical protein
MLQADANSMAWWKWHISHIRPCDKGRSKKGGMPPFSEFYDNVRYHPYQVILGNTSNMPPR